VLSSSCGSVLIAVTDPRDKWRGTAVDAWCASSVGLMAPTAADGAVEGSEEGVDVSVGDTTPPEGSDSDVVIFADAGERLLEARWQLGLFVLNLGGMIQAGFAASKLPLSRAAYPVAGTYLINNLQHIATCRLTVSTMSLSTSSILVDVCNLPAACLVQGVRFSMISRWD
jgi:hypothetical protein